MRWLNRISRYQFVLGWLVLMAAFALACEMWPELDRLVTALSDPALYLGLTLAAGYLGPRRRRPPRGRSATSACPGRSGRTSPRSSAACCGAGMRPELRPRERGSTRGPTDALVGVCGQGRGRTADIPLFRSHVNHTGVSTRPIVPAQGETSDARRCMYAVELRRQLRRGFGDGAARRWAGARTEVSPPMLCSTGCRVSPRTVGLARHTRSRRGPGGADRWGVD